MLMPPVATGVNERDDESIGRSTSAGRQVLSDRSAGQEVNGGGNAGATDFKRAYLKVSARMHPHSKGPVHPNTPVL